MKTINRNKLSAFLKQKRMNVGLSQKEVSDELGYSTAQFISNWERGLSNPPIKVLKTLGDLYGVSADELFEVTLASAIDGVTRDLKRRFAEAKVK